MINIRHLGMRCNFLSGNRSINPAWDICACPLAYCAQIPRIYHVVHTPVDCSAHVLRASKTGLPGNSHAPSSSLTRLPHGALETNTQVRRIRDGKYTQNLQYIGLPAELFLHVGKFYIYKKPVYLARKDVTVPFIFHHLQATRMWVGDHSQVTRKWVVSHLKITRSQSWNSSSIVTRQYCPYAENLWFASELRPCPEWITTNLRGTCSCELVTHDRNR